MYKIKQSTLSCDKGKWICVLTNPYVKEEFHFTRVIMGGSHDIVERKVIKQLKAWELTKDEDNARFEQGRLDYAKLIAERKNNDDDLPF